MGLLCGSFGINVAHELGHRSNGFERTLSRMLLLSSLYMHFYIEHNKGHHKRVSTPEDPASARYGENVYAFYVRTLVFSWLSAWEIAARDLKKKGLPAFHWRNEMLQYQLIQIAFVAIIWYVFGWRSTLFFLAAAFLGALLLETVNYIEHYGLVRKCRAEGTYERVLPEHSWNSDHVLGRLMLFELSRHSDHHYSASRKYQVLRHHQYAPQMPTGYPGMMILSLIPPLWFRVMHRKMQQLTVSS
jgi:alkane 1-monooxygenase